MPKINYPIINFGKRFKEDYIGALTNTATKVKIPDEIDGTTLALRDNLFQNNTSLTEIDFGSCTAVPAYCCYSCSNLTKVTFAPNTRSVGPYAFYNDQKLVIPFDSLNTPVSVGNYAFNYAKVTSIDGTFTAIGQYAFSDIDSLTKLHLSIKGTIGDAGLGNCPSVSDFLWDPNSEVPSLGSAAFYYLGYNRSNPTQNPFFWDLRNSGFTSIPGSCWEHSRASTYLFSSKLASIGAYAFSYSADLTLYLNSLPTLSASNVFTSSTNFNIVVDYNLDAETLKTMTNWTGYASYIRSGITDFIGVLPSYTDSTGVAVEWYSDAALTVPVSEASDRKAFYYASKGSEREVWLAQPTLVDASIIISDGSAVYDKFVPVGTTVTITSSGTDPDKSLLYLLKVDGVDYTAVGSATVVADHNIQIVAVYWDGVHRPFLPNLADNDFSMIKLASQMGTVPDTWLPGDEIIVKYDGSNYKCRLVDKTGKFTRVADGSTAYLYFEFENLLPDNVAYSRYYSNVVADSPLLASMNSGDIWGKLDPDLKAVLEDVNVLVSPKGFGSPAPTNYPFKLFLPREADLFSTRGYSVQSEFNAIAQDEYYQTHNTNNDRRKAGLASPTSYIRYWELSPTADNSWYACYVSSSGVADRIDVSSNSCIAPRFVL